MSDTIESRGKSIEEAVAEALLRLGARRDEVDITVLDEGKGGLFGMLGGRPARVRVARRPAAGRGGGRESGHEERGAPPARHHGPSRDTQPAAATREAPSGDRTQADAAAQRRKRHRGGRGRRRPGEADAPPPLAFSPGEGGAEEPQTREIPASAEAPQPLVLAAASLAKPQRGEAVGEAPAVIERLATELMVRSGFPCRCEVRAGEYHQVKITTDEISAGVLIGRHGGTIDALEHLVERMASQAVGAPVRMNLDINNYRRRREEKLVQRAQQAAERVLATGQQMSFEALCARERRVVHLEVARMAGVQTFTVEDDLGKHVVVAPAGATPPAGADRAAEPGYGGQTRPDQRTATARENEEGQRSAAFDDDEA